MCLWYYNAIFWNISVPQCSTTKNTRLGSSALSLSRSVYMLEPRWKFSPLFYNCSSPGKTCCWLVDINSNQPAAYPTKYMLL